VAPTQRVAERPSVSASVCALNASTSDTTPPGAVSSASLIFVVSTSWSDARRASAPRMPSSAESCSAARSAIADSPSRTAIQHKTLSQPGIVYQTELLGCRWLSYAEDNKEGSDALFLEVTLDPIDVIKTLANGTRVSLL
jgi:hypothetical protein